MNFKTTIFLIALLAIAAITVYFVHQEPVATSQAPAATKNLLTISQDDVMKISITPADGSPLVMEHRGSDWEITQPVNAKADTFTAGDLVREICELQTHAQVGTDVATGVDHPNYRVELTEKGGKTTTLNFGNKSGVGDNLYVRVNDQPKVDVVGADVQAYLDKTVNDYRDMDLMSVTADAIQRLQISGSHTIELSKDGGKWEIVSPDHWQAEPSAMDELLSTLTSLRAASFVDHPLPAAMYQFNKPQLVVTYWSMPPGKATTQPTQNRIVFGGYVDVLKQNVFAQANGSVVKIAASTMDSLNKSPLDLRNRTLVDIDSAKVDRVELRKQLPATTQPIKREASKVDLVIQKNAKSPATTRPTSQPTSRPTTEASAAWVFANSKTAKVDEANVTDLLASLHPLKVEKYLEKLPTPLPSDRFHVAIMAGGKKYDFDFYATPANDSNATGVYDGTIFEVPNIFIDHLKLDFGWPAK